VLAVFSEMVQSFIITVAELEICRPPPETVALFFEMVHEDMVAEPQMYRPPPKLALF